MKPGFYASLLGGRIIFGKKTHVAVSPCGSPRFSFLKIAATPFGLPLLPEKGLARFAYSLVNALVYGSLSLTTFFGQGQGRSFFFSLAARAFTLCEFRISETRPSKSSVSETWLVASVVANNFLRLRARARLEIQVLPKNPGAPFAEGFSCPAGPPARVSRM